MHITTKSGVYLQSVQPPCTVHLQVQLSELYTLLTAPSYVHPAGTAFCTVQLPMVYTPWRYNSWYCTPPSGVHFLEVHLSVLHLEEMQYTTGRCTILNAVSPKGDEHCIAHSASGVQLSVQYVYTKMYYKDDGSRTCRYVMQWSANSVQY